MGLNNGIDTMKILFVAPTDPRDTTYGGQQRTHVVWKGLCSIPNATVCVVVPVAHQFMERFDEADGVFRVCLEKRWTPGWILGRLIKVVSSYFDVPLGKDIRKLRRFVDDVDVVISRLIQPAFAYKLWELAPLFIDVDDIQTLDWDLHAQLTGESRKPFYRFKRWLLGLIQNQVFAKACHLWLPVADNLTLVNHPSMSCLPNIACPPLPSVENDIGSNNELLFIGLMSSSPNYLALDSFLCDHWKQLKLDFPTFEFLIVGSGLPERYKVAWTQYDGVKVLGRVEDLRPLYKESLAVITPMLIGMGSCIKVLEALAMGRVVVTTRRGARGIPTELCTSDNGILLFDGYKELKASIIQLMDVKERRRMQLGAVAFVKENFSQEHINSTLYNDLKTTKVKV